MTTLITLPYVLLDRHCWFSFLSVGSTDNEEQRKAAALSCKRLDESHPHDAPHVCVILDEPADYDKLRKLACQNRPTGKLTAADGGSHASCPPGVVLQTGERVSAYIFRMFSEYPVT